MGSTEWTARQRRLLSAYAEAPIISRAALRAGVHRATVYRWLADPAFAESLQEAEDEYFRAHRLKVLADEKARQAWRQERERLWRPMRRYYLALASKARWR